MKQAVASMNGGSEIAEAGKRTCHNSVEPHRLLAMLGAGHCVLGEGRCFCGLLTQFAVLRWSRYRRRGRGSRSKSAAAGGRVVGWLGGTVPC